MSKMSERLRATIGAIVLIVVLASLPYLLDLYSLTVATQIVVYGVAAISLQLLWGRGGQLSFGHAAFFGLGAYAYAISSLKGALPSGVSLLVAVLVPALLGLIIGYFLFFGRVRGAYFSVITLALALIVNQLAISWQSVTGGDAGLINVPGFTLQFFQANIDLSTPVGAFYLAVSALSLALVATVLVHFSRIGLVFKAIREDEKRAEFMGYNTSGYLTALLVLSAALAGLAGGVFAAISNYAAPDMLGTVLSVEMLTWVAVGGRNYVVGALLGVVALRILNVQVSTVLPTSWPLVIGGFFVLVVLALPAGIVGTFVQIWRRVRGLAIRQTRGS